MRKKLLHIALVVLIPGIALCQEKPAVKLIAKVREKTILLRWGPTEPNTWQVANKNGYVVERYTVTRGTTRLATPEKTVLTTVPLKPKPLEGWRVAADTSDYAAIAAEALYSSSFSVSVPAKGVYEVVNRTQELQQRFSFALLAADHSFGTAKLSGIALEDASVKDDERYLYRVFISGTDARTKIDTGLYFISLADTVSMPPPSDVMGEFTDKVVKLTWPKSFLKHGYSSYIIERSDDKDKAFKKVNKNTFVNFDDPRDENFHFIDSLPANGVKYNFRIRGITPFGETGPPSDLVTGSGARKTRVTASIREAYEISPGKVKIGWAISGEVAVVKGIYVQRSAKADGKYTPIHKEMMPREVDTFTDQQPYPTNYYRIKLVGEKDSVFSFPYLTQLVDSIPPRVPAGLKGQIDTLGVVRLTWNKNSEPDLLGYRVFRSNFLRSEFSQVTSDPVADPSFADTIVLKTLTGSIFYKIVAVDLRFNPSAYSEVVKLEKPDIVPPAAPSIKSVVQKGNAVSIQWARSPSQDVTGYEVTRRSKSSTTWTVVRQVTRDSSSSVDPVGDQKAEFVYAIVAVDRAGNRSASQPYAIYVMPTARKPVSDLKASVDRTAKSVELKWKKSEVGISKYLVYRAEEDAPLALYKTVIATADVWVDKDLGMNKKYRYRIKSVFSDGTESNFSNELEVKY